MIKYKSFYHLTITLYSAKSGQTLTVVDDFYTPHIIGLGDDFNDFAEKSHNVIKLLNVEKVVEDNGGEFNLKFETCCFNNGAGRSISAQTNVEPYLVRNKNEPENKRRLGSIIDDKALMAAINDSMDWLKKQQPPF